MTPGRALPRSWKNGSRRGRSDARPGRRRLPGVAAVLSNGRLTNWAGNVTFSAQRVRRPESVGELRRIVAGSERARALGTGHSFNPIADTPGDLVSVARLPKVMEIDAGAKNAQSCSSRTAAGDRSLSRSKDRFQVAATGTG